MKKLKRKAGRVFYYARNVVRDIAPQALFRARLDVLLARSIRCAPSIRERINYYNKLSQPFTPSPEAVTIATLPFRPTMYYYDLKEFARYFDPGLRLDLEFGDVEGVRPMPSIVKDRPIHCDNRNSVLFKMDKFRHFHMPADPIPFSRKLPMAVWRGDLNNPRRTVFLDAVRGLACCDAGTPSGEAPARYRRPFLSPDRQKRYRYIVSLEGNDVATNLKWVMSSNSLCLMPPPTYEIWFCEGHLEPNVHYAPLAPDFSDVEQQIAYYERHPQEAERIIAAANAYCRRFLDESAEKAISLLVLYKYFVLSGQIEPDPAVWDFITGPAAPAAGIAEPALSP